MFAVMQERREGEGREGKGGKGRDENSSPRPLSLQGNIGSEMIGERARDSVGDSRF